MADVVTYAASGTTYINYEGSVVVGAMPIGNAEIYRGHSEVGPGPTPINNTLNTRFDNPTYYG